MNKTLKRIAGSIVAAYCGAVFFDLIVLTTTTDMESMDSNRGAALLIGCFIGAALYNAD